MVLSLFLCFPLGLTLTWTTKWTIRSKAIVTAITLGFLLVLAVASANKNGAQPDRRLPDRRHMVEHDLSRRLQLRYQRQERLRCVIHE